jgi:polyhydroxyalkanoate synthesis regulator phasin
VSEQPGTPAPSGADTATLERLVTHLEDVATRLRAGDLDADEAARLVDDCAQVASNASAELERLARVAASEPLPGQDQLL